MGCTTGPPWDLDQQQDLMWKWGYSQPPATSRSLTQRTPKQPALKVIRNLQGISYVTQSWAPNSGVILIMKLS